MIPETIRFRNHRTGILSLLPSYSKLLPSNSKTFQDGNGNGNFEKINSNDFLDGNWESMAMKG